MELTLRTGRLSRIRLLGQIKTAEFGNLAEITDRIRPSSLLSYELFCWQQWHVAESELRWHCMWNWFAYVFVLKAINQGKILELRPILQSITSYT